MKTIPLTQSKTAIVDNTETNNMEDSSATPLIIRLHFCKSCGQFNYQLSNCSTCNYPYQEGDVVAFVQLDNDVNDLLLTAEARISELERQLAYREHEIARSEAMFQHQKTFADDMVKINRDLFAHSQALISQTREISERFKYRIATEAHERAVDAFRQAAVQAIQDVKNDVWVGSFYKPYFVRAVQCVKVPADLKEEPSL